MNLIEMMGDKNDAKKIAEEKGFFVISATGDIVIKNKKNFQAKAFC